MGSTQPAIAAYKPNGARDRFIRFALEDVSEDPRIDEFVQNVGQEWSTKTSETQGLLDSSILGLNLLHNQARNQLTHATDCKLMDNELNSPPTRATRRRLRRFLDALQDVQNTRRTFLQGTETLVDQYIAWAGFSGVVIALFRTRVRHALNSAAEVQPVINDITLQIIEMEKLPGLNPRKIQYHHNQQDRAIRGRDLNAGVREQPLEHQPEFQSSAIPFGNWQPAYTLGGGMAQAALWVDVDHDGTIVNRIVRKDTRIEPSGWADATRWHGNMGVGKLFERVPMEYHIQKTLQGQQEAQYVVPAMKCEVDVPKLLYRLYLAYCPYGDLGELIQMYTNSHMILPEAFLWRVFEALVETGLIMQKGKVFDSGADWLEIVHRDLKPNNIFLDLRPAEGSPYPRYPLPKLADFGLAFQTSPDDPLNPTIWNGGAGTMGHLPPEQSPFVDAETRQRVDTFKLLAHTNVWSIGAIMWSLAHRHELRSHEQLNYLPSDTTPNPAFSFELPTDTLNSVKLSRELLDIIARCLRFDPADRPTFEELAEYIDDFVTTNQRDGGVGQYLHQAAQGQQPENEEHDVHGLEDQFYKLGFAFNGAQWELRSSGLSQPQSSGFQTVEEGAEVDG